MHLRTQRELVDRRLNGVGLRCNRRNPFREWHASCAFTAISRAWLCSRSERVDRLPVTGACWSPFTGCSPMGGGARLCHPAGTMPRGSKAGYTDKQKRQASHIEKGYEQRGVSEKTAKARAWATVNRTSGGGKKAGSARKSAHKA
jgi:hypothetical protein